MTDSLRKLLRRNELEGHYDVIRSAVEDTSYDALIELSVVQLIEQCGLSANAAIKLRKAAVAKTGAWAKWKRRRSLRFSIGGGGEAGLGQESDDVDMDDDTGADSAQRKGRKGVSSATVDKSGGRRRQSMIGRLMGTKGACQSSCHHSLSSICDSYGGNILPSCALF